ncbi:ganglioside-induced differentiation-associated protein 1 isoform X5 [Narcine bancroftii]|uniref:ganglioside-induced differentiation-associated protein 1 isoform X5 n=1 Tax=Narcine bancroftii TaxID=1343680 RepID=UPI0038321434
MAGRERHNGGDEASDVARWSQQQDNQGMLKCENTRSKMVLYHWSQSFCSQKVRLVIAEKGLKCEEYDVNLPLSEHNEPWFMRLNPAGEVPVLIHGDNIICESTQIIDYLESKFEDVIPFVTSNQ